MAESGTESDHFSDIFDSTSDLTHVIGHLDRQLRISEETDDVNSEENESLSSRAQPRSIALIDAPAATTTTTTTTTSGQAETSQAQRNQSQISKGAFPNRSLSSSTSTSEDDDQLDRPGRSHSGSIDHGNNAHTSISGGVDAVGRGGCVLERAAMEIIDSEGSYVEDLRQVIEGYLLDWKERACLKLDELETLFGNIEQLYAVNSRLNSRLKRTEGNVEQIAKCFLDLRDEFTVYTTYCTRYPDAIALLTRLLQSTHTNSLLTSTQKVLNHTLPLGSFLLKPVQRIMKYHLLLDNLRKHCTAPEVEEAHQQMLKVARDIDQMKKALEQKGRVRQLCGILDGWLGPELTVLGELRHEGVLEQNGKPREVFLFDTMLIIAKPKEDRRLQFKSYIHRKDIMLVEQIPGEPCSFFVIPYSDPRNQIKFLARNRNQKRLWAHHIKAVMLEDLNIPNRAKDLVFQLGDEEDVPPDKSLKKWGHTSTPDYLERRHRYRRSEIKERSKQKPAAAKELSVETPRKEEEGPNHSYDACCADGKDCSCAIVKQQLKEDIASKRPGESEEENPVTVPINKYTTNAMPKRIMNLKKTRSKTVPSSVFYATLSEMQASQDLNDSVDNSSTNDSQEQLNKVAKEGGEGQEDTRSEASTSVGGSRRGSEVVVVDRAVRGNKSSTLRASDSHLNYVKVTSEQFLTRSNTISNDRAVSGGGKVKKNSSSLYKSWRSVKEEESRVSFQHLPGSSNLGERIANVDYADPQRLFCVKSSSSSHRRSEIITSKSVGQQRDSVVSVTSSSDSVDESRSKPEAMVFDKLIGDDSYYEDDIERCLEDASLFRDSAIYSDDNEQRRIQPPMRSSSNRSSGQEPPPPVPHKPKHVTEMQQKKLKELATKKLERQLSGGKSTVPAVPLAQTKSFLYRN